jgi:hypothetical protein
MQRPDALRPPPPEDERDLIRRAGEAMAEGPSCDRRLAALVTERGIDFATAALYHHVRSDARRLAFFERIEGDGPRRAEVPRVVIMPGAFAAEYPHTGADGARVMELAALLGWPAERIKVPSLAPMTENAEALARVLAAQPCRPTVVASLSKGGADVRAALERPDAAEVMRDVRAWVSLSGIVTGTPLVAWLRARPIRYCGARLLLRLRRQRFAVVDELRRGPGSPLDKPLALPPGMRAIHVFGFPLQRHLGDAWARRGHARLAPLGPNDGGGNLLADVMRLPGDVYPVWGADHYLRPAAWDIRPLLLRILREAAWGSPP